jgi:hypothetical protein
VSAPHTRRAAPPKEEIAVRISRVCLVLSVCAAALVQTPRAEASEPEIVLDNRDLGRDLARRDAEERRARYQGDSPFAEDQPSSRRAEEERFRPLAVTLNPLTLLLGRLGANVEFLPAPHHGIMLNPYYSSASLESGPFKTKFESYGAELGYHFYTGKRGANGFFVGPSFVLTRTKMSSSCADLGCEADPEVDFLSYGVALDLGGQVVFGNGVTLGAGGGLMYLKSSAVADGSTTLRFEGSVPRLLFTVGYSI